MNDFGEMMDSRTVRFQRLLPGPVERVWSYIVESDKRAQWLCAGDVDAQPGGQARMLFDNESLSSDDDIERPATYGDMPARPVVEATVTACDPPYLLVHTWLFAGEESEVRYELVEQEDKVLLVLTHSRLESPDTVLSVCGGWHTHLDILVAVLAGGQPLPFWKTHSERTAQYEERLRG